MEETNTLVPPKVHERLPDQSEQLNELFAALAKAQGEMMVAHRGSENPFFKTTYAGLKEVVDASRPALSKYGLSVIMRNLPNDEGVSESLCYLGHSSGQYIVSRMVINPPKSDIQSFGSYMTYIRRYLYMAITGVVTGFDDDDGEKAMADARLSMVKTDNAPAKYDSNNFSPELISKDQLTELEFTLRGYPKLAKHVIDSLEIGRLAYMKKEMFNSAIERIRELKAQGEAWK